jgi:glycosyltransferase involved in cell wall biosynthesis
MRSARSRTIERVGFVSTRIAGTDGVSLEISKWAKIIDRMGVECYFIAGESDQPAERTFIIDITRRAFGTELRTAQLTNEIMEMTRLIRDKLDASIEHFRLDALIAENALTIPMNLPLGIALVHEVQERPIGCLAHHHDFYWERDRFLINCVDDIIQFAFPPALQQIQHVVINSLAGEEFSRRTGLSCRIIPNVMDFAHPPDPPDDYARQFRREIGLRDDDLLILQPTRVVARKGIEHSIELARRLAPRRAKLVITHASGDEGDAYAKRIREFAELMDVSIVFADGWVSDQRGIGADGRKLFTIHDVYPQADLVAYPSTYEGFGNAFLEAVYYKCPIVCNRYAIYRTDIEPCGLRPILFDVFPTDETIEEIHRVLEDRRYRQEMVEHNYEVASQFFSYEVVEDELHLMMRRPQNIYRLLGRRAQTGRHPR